MSPSEHSRAALAKGRRARMKASRERAWRFGVLRRGGFSIQEAAWDLGVSKRTGERYEARLREQKRREAA